MDGFIKMNNRKYYLKQIRKQESKQEIEIICSKNI